MRLKHSLMAGLVSCGMLATVLPAAAQLFSRPSRDIPVDGEDAPVRQGQDNGALLLRIDRLENQLRGLTGQIEQMQFQQRKADENLRKFQQDMDLRLQDAGKRPLAAKPADVSAVVAAPSTPGAKRRPGDAFEPGADPAAPGNPRVIGTLRPGEPSPVRPVSPRPTLPAGPIAIEPVEPGAPVEIGKGGPLPSSPPGQPPIGAFQPPAAPLNDYDSAVALYKQGQYEAAEKGFSAYLQKNPNSRLVADAIFYLGETYFQRQRHREAAEQYLKLSTDYAKSNRAPDSLVRLGMSLTAMGAREQACATFGEVARKYPASSTAIRGADRESKKAHC